MFRPADGSSAFGVAMATGSSCAVTAERHGAAHFPNKRPPIPVRSWTFFSRVKIGAEETYGAGSRTVLLRSNFEMLLVRFSGFDLNDRFEKKFCGCKQQV
jgi:hypothetical protein